MYTVDNDTIQIHDSFNMTIAHIHLCHQDEYHFVMGYPTMGIWEYYKDARNPFSYLSGPVRWTQEGFLDWLARIAGFNWASDYEPTIAGVTGDPALFYQYRLTRSGDTENLVRLLSFPDDVIRPFLARHATFTDQA